MAGKMVWVVVVMVLILGSSWHPAAAMSVCGNGVVEGGEECDPGGPRFQDSPSGQLCATSADCSDGGTCVSGHCRCTTDAECGSKLCAGGPDGFRHCTCAPGGDCFYANSGGCCKFNCQAVGSGLVCDDGNPCSIGEHCNQVGICECSGGCNPSAGVGSVCRAATGECDPQELCEAGIGCPPDVKSQPGTPCSDDGNACTADQCDGTSAVCRHPPGNAGAVCRAAGGECDPAERCTGTSATCPLQSNPDGTPCSDEGNPCTDDVCNGAGVCQHPNNTAPCADDSNPCTVDQCSAGACIHSAGNAGAVCRGTGGVCDVAEACTGTSTVCPPDTKSISVCRPAAGPCDVAESCDGVSDTCPADSFTAATIECRPAGGVCDQAENCTGSAANCPADAKRTSICRPAASGCDTAESCDGVHNNCPTDAYQPAGRICNFGGNACQQGACNGSGACAFGFNRPLGTDCNDGLYCNGADACNGAGTCTHGGDPCPGSQCNTCQEDDDSCLDPAGVGCDDGEACTVFDQCDGEGHCAGTNSAPQYAIISLVPAQSRGESVFTGMRAHVGGGICTSVFTRAGRALIDGDVVAMAQTNTALTCPRSLPPVYVSGQCVTGGGSIVGAHACAGGVDRSSGSPLLESCEGAMCKVGVRLAEFVALPSTPGCNLPALKLIHRKPDSTFPASCVVANGRVVIDTPEIRVGLGRKLTLAGSPGTQVIVRVHGPLKITRNAQLAVQGVSPADVLYMVDGPVTIGPGGRLAGSVYGGKNAPMRVALNAVANGQLVGAGGVHLARGGSVEPTPFAGW